jgi:Fe-S cluster assembly iron-binding protein IscA
LAQNYGKEEVMVSLTDSAVTKFKEVVSKQGSAGDGVRIFVVPGG